MKWLAMLSASVLWGSSYAAAGELPPENTPLQGYQCYTVNEQTLHLTQDDYFSGAKFPVILEKPEDGSKSVGRVPGIFYVKWPLTGENGFVQVLHYIPGPGWILPGFRKEIFDRCARLMAVRAVAKSGGERTV